MFQITGIMAALLLGNWLALCLFGGVVAEFSGSQFWRGLVFAVIATMSLMASFRLAQIILPSWSESRQRLIYCCIALAIWTFPMVAIFWLMF